MDEQRDDGFVPLMRLDELPLDQGVKVTTGGRELAVFRLTDPAGVYVIDNACPHASGNLSEGDLLKGGVVRCPWHAWKFRLCDGAAPDGTRARVNAYPVEVRDGTVHVRLTPMLTFWPKHEEA